MWLIGGENATSKFYDVWTSIDGKVWTQTNTSLPFDATTGTGVSYNGEVWAFGFGINPWVWNSNCCLKPTPTGTLPGNVVMKAISDENELVTAFTASPTPTVSPSPTSLRTDSFSIITVPNVSKSGQPIQFEVVLGSPAQINLALYNLTGNLVYQTSEIGSAGLNTLLWKLENQSQNPVASGLYIYSIQTVSNGSVRKKIGKVVVIH